MLADSVGAAHCNDRDFGTSRTGSYRIKLHLLPGRVEGGAMTADGLRVTYGAATWSLQGEKPTSREHPEIGRY